MLEAAEGENNKKASAAKKHLDNWQVNIIFQKESSFHEYSSLNVTKKHVVNVHNKAQKGKKNSRNTTVNNSGVFINKSKVNIVYKEQIPEVKLGKYSTLNTNAILIYALYFIFNSWLIEKKGNRRRKQFGRQILEQHRTRRGKEVCEDLRQQHIC